MVLCTYIRVLDNSNDFLPGDRCVISQQTSKTTNRTFEKREGLPKVTVHIRKFGGTVESHGAPPEVDRDCRDSRSAANDSRRFQANVVHSGRHSMKVLTTVDNDDCR